MLPVERRFGSAEQSPNHTNSVAELRNDWSESQIVDPQFTFRFDNNGVQPCIPRTVPYTVGARLRRTRQLVVRHQEFQVQGEG